jgi:hypothetical protein
MNKVEIIDRLNEITKSYSFIYVLSQIVIRDFCGPIEVLFSKNNSDHLNHKEFAFLIGLWIKNVDRTILYEDDKHDEVFEEIYILMNNLHLTFFDEIDFNLGAGSKLQDQLVTGKMFQETMFYSGSGAYDIQYKETAIYKYKYDRDWIFKNKGFEVSSFSKFYDNIKNKLQEKLNSRSFRKKKFDKNCIVDIFSLNEKEIVNNNSDFKFILNALSIDIKLLNNQSFNNLGDFNVYSERPIIKIDKDVFYIPSCFAVSESMYESPFYWMQSDQKYLSKVQYNRGKVAEELTRNILTPLFGTDNIYHNLLINKTKNNQIGEIDILAIQDTRGIIFQIKSKKLTELSKNGNIESIKNDFVKAVENAYDQGINCRKYLENYKDYKFPQENEIFINRISGITEYNIVTIVLDDYPAITHQVHIFLGHKASELPVAINIFDLEILAKYLPKAELFIDYISRRTKYSKFYKAENEIGYLGFHLKKGLNNPGGYHIALDESWAQSIDIQYYNEMYQKKIDNHSAKKMPRNGPCYCNSGLKYKKCHGKN